MATILVDYENVSGANGLSGAEYLSEKDDLCIFYSNVCKTISREDSSHIEGTGCSFRICELRFTRKNALDFYIATEAGIAYESGAKQIIIVSRDEGFKSVCDYFEVKGYDAQIILAPTIEFGLLKLKSSSLSEVNRNLISRKERIVLSAECARINERRDIRLSIEECFAGTEYADFIPRVLACIDGIGVQSKKDLYTRSLHEFGRSSGTRIYNMLKQVV